MHRQQHGFSPVFIIIFVVLLAAAGFTGWRVWSASRESARPSPSHAPTPGGSIPINWIQDPGVSIPVKWPATQDGRHDTPNPYLSENTSTLKPAKPRDGSGYTIRFADGWNVQTKSGGSDDSYYMMGNEALATRPGIAPVVHPPPAVPSARGFEYGLVIDYDGYAGTTCRGDNTAGRAADFMTDSGLPVYESRPEVTDTSGQTSLSAEPDKIYYHYCVELPDKSVIGILYSLKPSDTDHSSILRGVIKSIAGK